MNRRQALTRARAILENKHIEDVSLEVEILLRHVLGISRAQLYSDLDRDLSPPDETALNEALERRLNGEPSAYITGHREFYGLDFLVDRNVLIPRPETELLVEKAIRLAKNNNIKIMADIGTGCGPIAISLAANLPGVTVYATDLSAPALEVARANCERHGVAERVILLQGDMLEPLPECVDLIIANLPYVRASDLPGSGPLSHEPALALDGGADGLDRTSVLCRRAGEKLRKGSYLLLEIGQGQSANVTKILKREYPAALTNVYRDLAGIERVVSLRLT